MQKRAGPFGPGIRAVREERGLSLRKLGEMSGLKHQTIHEIEKGTIPNLETATRLSVALEMTIEQILEAGHGAED